MKDLQAYQSLKTYITTYFLGDTRLPVGGFYWGESKRVLDAMKTKIKYPYVWIDEVRYYLTGDRLTGLYATWGISMSCKGNAKRDDIQGQEARLQECKDICHDFLLWLGDQAEEEEIIFDRSQVQLVTSEVYETDDNWGWSLNFRISTRLPSMCSPRHDDQASYKHVQALRPVSDGSEGIISLTVDTLVYDFTWTIAYTPAQIAAIFRDRIGSAHTDITTFSDESSLYLIPNTPGADIVVDTTTAAHAWQ